jgi:hypothetical protein
MACRAIISILRAAQRKHPKTAPDDLPRYLSADNFADLLMHLARFYWAFVARGFVVGTLDGDGKRPCLTRTFAEDRPPLVYPIDFGLFLD